VFSCRRRRVVWRHQYLLESSGSLRLLLLLASFISLCSFAFPPLPRTSPGVAREARKKRGGGLPFLYPFLLPVNFIFTCKRQLFARTISPHFCPHLNFAGPKTVCCNHSRHLESVLLYQANSRPPPPTGCGLEPSPAIGVPRSSWTQAWVPPL